ncbi:hypothetical protein ACH427_01945 [Streptomyces sp. NPDC020379]|uniref:hypothetical protein n=1 Tax=Streptomyces sp. NPDC020379 TaxID=3365071 RepID=UPI0037B40951
MRSRRRVGAGAAAAVLTLVALAGNAPVAQAHGYGERQPFVCLGQYRTSWTPGLTLATRPARISTTESYTCADGRAAGSFNGTLSASCLQVNGSPFSEVIRYADGGTSVIAYTENLRARAGAASLNTLHGHVTEGRYRGHAVLRTAQLLHEGLPTECLTPVGLRHGAGLAELVIT